jgi:HEAT repeat protein
MGHGELSEAGVSQRASRHRLSVRALLVLVATCGALLWAARVVWESTDPSHAATLALRSRDPERRQLAAIDLGRDWSLADAEAVHALIAAVRDPVPAVRAAAIDSLGVVINGLNLGGTRADLTRKATGALLDALADANPRVRAQAAFAIGTAFVGLWQRVPPVTPPPPRLPPPFDPAEATARLLKLLDDPEMSVRTAAIRAVGSIGQGTDLPVPPELLAALRDDSLDIRNGAVDAVAGFQYGIEPAIPILIDLFEHDQPQVRETVRSVLSRILPPASAVPELIAGLGHAGAELQPSILGILYRMGPTARAAVPALLEQLKRDLASERTGLNDPPHNLEVPGIWLDWPSVELERTLGQIAPGSPQEDAVVAALIEGLRSPYRDRHPYAADSLAGFGRKAEPAVPILIDSLKRSAASPDRSPTDYNFVQALGQLAPGTAKEDEALAALIGLLDSGDESLIGFALPTLTLFGPKAAAAMPKVRALANDPRLSVRSNAAVFAPRIEALADGPEDEPIP